VNSEKQADETILQAYALLNDDQRRIQHQRVNYKVTTGRSRPRRDRSNTSSGRRAILSIVGVTLAIGVVVTNMHMIYGLLSAVFPIDTAGVVASANIRICWESECANNVSYISWGTIDPGQSKNVTVYVKNTGTVPLTLSFNTTNWNPSAANAHIALSWDYDGSQVQPDQVLPVTFALVVSESAQGLTSFSFDINITGTQAT